MGILRLFLAASVLVGHTGPLFGFQMMFSDVAVKLFFIISGFYMSLVLSGKYRGRGQLWTFYTNRFLRLYPGFFIAIIVTFTVFAVANGIPSAPQKSPFVQELAQKLSGGHGTLGTFELAALLVPNLLIVGSDIAFLFHHTVANGWQFTYGILPTAGPDTIRGGSYLLIAPVWSIGVELWFYLLVPTLTRARTWILILLALSSIALRLGMEWHQQFTSYFFFPAAFCFFLFGMLAHRFWCSALFKRLATRSRVMTIAACGLALLMLREFIPFYRNYPELIYTVAVISLPCIFQAFKNVEWDRWVGNMSYPVYLFHTSVIVAAQDFLGWNSTAPILAATLGVSFVVNYFVEEPLERYRLRRAVGRKSAAPVLKPA